MSLDAARCHFESERLRMRPLEAGDAEALSLFERLAEQCPEDPLVAFHLRRLSEGESGAVIVLKEK